MNRVAILLLWIGGLTGQVSAQGWVFPPPSPDEGCRAPSKDWTVADATRALKADPFRLDSRESKDFRFEFYGRSSKPEADGTRAVLRASAERHGDRVSLRMQEAGGGPLGLYRDGRLFRLERNLAWEYAAEPGWTFFVDHAHSVKFFDDALLAPQESARAVCEPARAILGTLEDGLRKVEWNPVARVLTFRKVNGTVVFARFRSPYDELAYGTYWSEFHSDSSGGTDIVVGGFVRGESHLYSPPTDVPTLIAALEAKKVKTLQQLWGRPPVDDPVERALGLRLEVALAPETFRGNAASKVRDMFADAFEPIVIAREQLRQGRAPDPQAWEADIRRVSKFVAGLFALQADLIAMERHRFPDDPTMARIEAEARLTASMLSYWMNKLVLPVLEDAGYDLGTRLELADAVADLGLPFPACVEERLVKMRKDPLCDAVFRSRLCEPCDETHLAAAREVVRAAQAEPGKAAEPGKEVDPRTERAAAETLLRLDAWADVPAAVADRWFEYEVARPAVKEFRKLADLNEGRRIRALTLLSAWPSGRADLIRRLRAAPADAEWRAAGAAALLLRVAAARETRRFEELPEKECRALRHEFMPFLSAKEQLEPKVPGTAERSNSSDGAEKPSGTDNPGK